jgi:hypothetical protein
MHENNIAGKRDHQARWQFNLRGLMFLMFVVALCAWLVGISILLGIVCVPVIAAAAVRAVRVRRPFLTDEQRRRTAPGLFTAFGKSVAILLSLFTVFAATSAVACLAAGLVLLETVNYVSRPVQAMLCRWIVIGWSAAIVLFRRVRRCAPRIVLARVVAGARHRAVRRTASFIQLTSTLLKLWRYPERA